MTKGQLPVNSIIAARYTYGDEIQNWEFYQIVSYSAKRVRIAKLRDITTYDDGMSGPHYYNDAKHCQPIEPYEWEDAPKSVSYKIDSYGYMIVKPRDYYQSIADWSGEPLEVYNLH